MRSKIFLSSLVVCLLGLNLLAAPAPPPSAILDIGPPPKGYTLEKYCNEEIGHMDFPHGMLNEVWCFGEVRKLPSVARFKDARSWLAKNLHIEKKDGGRLLRLTFRAGTYEEQAIILNALLRINLLAKEERVKYFEYCIRSDEGIIRDLEKRIAWEKDKGWIETYRKGIGKLRAIDIPASRAEIARLKKFCVTKWAK